MKRYRIWLWLCLVACQSQAQKKVLNGFVIENPIVPIDEIRVGNPQRDGIPALDSPRFVSAPAADYLSADDPVVGVVLNGQATAYPLKILTWHELVNDQVGNRAILVSYCPLCRSAYVFDREIGQRTFTFGVSGLLYNSNVLMYDRQTESLWSQVATEAVSGPLRGTELAQLSATTTRWQTWQSEHPDTRVLSTRTGYARDYQRSPYGDYASSPELMFPVTETSDRFHPKALVAGVAVDGAYKAYPFSVLEQLPNNYLQDILGSKVLTLRVDKLAQSVEVADQNGRSVPVNVLYWFTWYAFHLETLVYSGRSKN